mmetsp:Transcript_28905/g.70461  ORF Transcript_28905/g.70461 Transcript_28905/m.70461 type:complete len:205 (-) Transcript_28905:318-932(-)
MKKCKNSKNKISRAPLWYSWDSCLGSPPYAIPYVYHHRMPNRDTSRDSSYLNRPSVRHHHLDPGLQCGRRHDRRGRGHYPAFLRPSRRSGHFFRSCLHPSRGHHHGHGSVYGRYHCDRLHGCDPSCGRRHGHGSSCDRRHGPFFVVETQSGPSCALEGSDCPSDAFCPCVWEGSDYHVHVSHPHRIDQFGGASLWEFYGSAWRK